MRNILQSQVGRISCIFALSLFLTSCAGNKQPAEVKYPRKSTTSSSRQSGPAMSFYEQAEEDLDVANDIIVIPPEEVEENKKAAEKTQ